MSAMAQGTKGESAEHLPPSAVMVINVVMTVTIVVINKLLFTAFKFDFAPTTLLTLQQGTCAVMAFMGAPRESTAKGVPPRLLAFIIATQVMSIVLANLSLKFNSLGSYQLLKMLNIPFVYVGEWKMFGLPWNLQLVLMLGLVCFGVGLATLSEVAFSVVGLACGLFASAGAAFNALAKKHVANEYALVGNDLLRSTAPGIVLLQSGLAIMTDDLTRIPAWLEEARFKGAGLVLLSCCIVWVLEWSSVMVVHLTSAMTMQVLGHVKTLLIIISGFVLFHAPVVPRVLLGCLISVVGVMGYSRLKTRGVAHRSAASDGEELLGANGGGSTDSSPTNALAVRRASSVEDAMFSRAAGARSTAQVSPVAASAVR